MYQRLLKVLTIFNFAPVAEELAEVEGETAPLQQRESAFCPLISQRLQHDSTQTWACLLPSISTIPSTSQGTTLEEGWSDRYKFNSCYLDWVCKCMDCMGQHCPGLYQQQQGSQEYTENWW